MSLVEIARSAGIDLKEDSRDYYRGVDHDSLVIDAKKNLWKWNSQNLGGGAIEFATTFLDQKGFYQAVKFLNAGHYDETKIQTAPIALIERGIISPLPEGLILISLTACTKRDSFLRTHKTT